jgi:hypothetical protein
LKTLSRIGLAELVVVLALPIGAVTLQAQEGRQDGLDTAKSVPLLYVANASGEVTAYDPGSSGAVAPLIRIAGPATELSDSWAVAFDPAGFLYVQSFGGYSRTVRFRNYVTGDVAPLRVFDDSTGARDACSIAVDSNGNAYITRLASLPVLEVFAPNSRGSVLPSRTLQLDGFPTSVTIDASDNVIVGLLNTPNGNALEVFGPSAQGAAQPLRKIAGPATGLGKGSFNLGGFLVVSYSRFTNRIYAAPSGDLDPSVPAHICVFAVDADGNIAPVRSISGPATLLGETVTGLAGDQETGEIFALSVNSKLATPTMIHVYTRLAHGDVAPLRSFTDQTSHLQNAIGIAFAPLPPSAQPEEKEAAEQ